MTVELKRGSSFRVAFQFESDEEWAALFPADYAISQAKFGDLTFDLEVVVDQLSRCVFIKGDTEEWPIGEGAFDFKVIVGDLIQTVPALVNIPLIVGEGITS